MIGTEAIEVLEIKPIAKGNLKAFVKIRLGDIVINGVRIIQQAGQQAWVSCPQQTVERDGEKSYFPIIQLSKPLKLEMQTKVLAAWEREQIR